MNNLHRELAPISRAAWSQIEEEVARTFKRAASAGRRVVDVKGPGGTELSGVGTGHQMRTISAPQQGVVAKLSEVKALVQLTVPFELQRDAIDSARARREKMPTGSLRRRQQRSSLMPRIKVRDLRRRYVASGDKWAGFAKVRRIRLLRNALPADVSDYPNTISNALEQLRLAGVDGPLSRCCSAPMPIRRSARHAIRVIRFSNTSSGS